MIVSWLKLDVGIMDDQKIKIIRKYPAGDSLFVLWIGLLTFAMKNNRAGVIEIADGIPYSAEELANVLEIEVKTVQMGLEIFRKFGMIDYLEGGMIEICNFRKHQNLDKIENNREMTRKRVAKHREQLKLTSCNALLTQSNANREDIDKIKKENKKSQKEKSPVQILIDAYHDHFLATFKTKPAISGVHGTTFKSLLKDFDQDDIHARLGKFFKDEYWMKKMCPVTAFKSQFNKYLDKPKKSTHNKGTIIPDIQVGRQ